MSLVNTINFLPQVFQSPTNQRFLGATMDQLTTGPLNTPVNGSIGRTFAPTYKFGDNYVPELTKQRANYQLEAGVVVKNSSNEIEFTAGYIDLLNSINRYGGLTNNHQRLFGAESYSYDGHFDYDKFVNYYNYYWLPNGPQAVDVFANETPYYDEFTVTRNTDIDGYVFSGVGVQPNLQLTLARGGTYKFKVNQPGNKFWIQTESGVSGTDSKVATVSTRDVYGVTNNGTDNGEITFQVPLSTAQDFYITMPIVATIDAATPMHYTDIAGRLLSDFLTEFPQGLDGINNNLQNKTFIFINNDIDDSQWTVNNVTVAKDKRRNVWKIDLVPTGSDFTIRLISFSNVVEKEKVFVSSGKTYASNQYWLNGNFVYQHVPNITATADYLYYQDSNNPGFVGMIKLVDNKTGAIDVPTDILGQKGYTSPNGVQFTNGLKVRFDSSTTPIEYAGSDFYVEGVGTSIYLVSVDQLVVTESFGSLMDTTEDYITINRASRDLNPWTRSNRWFHKDVIEASATYNNRQVEAADYGPNLLARRPIVEFEPNLQLWKYGREAKNNVDFIVLDPTDAFNDIEGKQSASIDGIDLKNGDRVIFANDYDTTTLNEVYEVRIRRINSTNYVTLILTADDPVIADQNILVTSGSHAGKTYKFTGSAWELCQEKPSANYPPLFDLVDADGYSFGDTTVYPDSTFAGTQFFGYKVGTGTDDVQLGFPLTYQNFNNIGDIVFTNFYDNDSFSYVQNLTTQTVKCSTGYLVKSSDLTTTEKVNNWTLNSEVTEQYQIFTKFFDGYVVEIDGVQRAFVQIDVLPNAQTTVPFIKVFLNNSLLTINVDYTVVKYGVYHLVVLSTVPTVGDKIDVAVFSDSVSALAYYEIPENLDRNPLNENFTSITLGQLRTHYNKLIENTSVSSTGSIPLQDNYLKGRRGTLTQHSSPLVYAMAFLNDPMVNFVDGANLARKEYTKFKNKFLTLCSSLSSLDYNNPVTGVDTILQNINLLKNSTFSWYYSDMVPQGNSYNTITYKVLNVRQTQYEISSIFDTTQLSNRAVIIYKNNEQLTLGVDYTFSNVSPAVNFTTSFQIGDVITIRDYANTDGNYIPETPTKLGLYPKSVPEIYVDNTYQTPTTVIRGHDGSITPAFGDFRDDYLLELEHRIYNNIKADYSKNELDYFDIIPGRFRKTSYSNTEFNEIIGQNFLNWVGGNNVDYSVNKGFDINNSWTWNYCDFKDRVDGSLLQGSWRAVYDYWFDTDTPNLSPWNMLGFSSKPLWWEERYGAAPYTNGNTLLWEDLEAGYSWNGSDADATHDTRFARPGLTSFIPVDASGQLLSPTDIPLIEQYNTQMANAAFSVGEQGPAENAWRRSSEYPYAVQYALALTQPARYFATQLDTSRFYRNAQTGQISSMSNQKITPSMLKVNGDASAGTIQRTSGYINWIADNIKNFGIDPITKLNEYFKNLDVQLSYKVGGFTDQRMITVSAEQTSPGSTSGSVIIPDTNYNVYLNKSVPTGSVVYSAVIVEKTDSGYSVTGYDTTNPFFTIIPSIANNKNQPITVNGITVKLYQEDTGTTQVIPYGTEFASVQQIADFLISYERHLVSQGFAFGKFNSDLQTQQNWTLSVQEFMHWSQQGWAPGTIIVLNPIATSIILETTGTVVDEITNSGTGNKVLDQNFIPIKSNSFNILRMESAQAGNTFTLTTLNGSTIAFAKLNVIQFEHVLVFDNVSDFGDIIYLPSQGTRQYRLKLSGNKTGAWTGALSAPGYIYSDPIINQWVTGIDYRLGDIVMYNNNYYTAAQDIPASATFDSIRWTPIKSTDIQTGLLPSFGYIAGQFENIYDVDIPPSDEQLQEFSAGLIGFRQRQYLTDLGISIPTQTKFYQGYIKEKGSLNAITALTKANFTNITGDINTYEEWAFRVGQYGGVDTNTFREFVLDQSLFPTNPVAFTLTDTYSVDNLIANLTMANIYNSSNISNTTTTIYNDRAGLTSPTDLPTAGYVNLNDVDYTSFDITNFSGNIATMGINDKIWVAKDTNKEWNILRVNETPLTATALTYILDTYAQLTFDQAHDFVKGDTLVLKYFDDRFNGLYNILDVQSPTSVTISISNVEPEVGALSPLQALIRALTITGSGTVYALKSARVDRVTDIASIPTPINGWPESDLVWVNQATADKGWGVYSYNRAWDTTAVTEFKPVSTANARLGSAVKLNGAFVYSGSPGTRQVFANVISGAHTSAVITSTNAGFGKLIESQGNVVVVASNANVHVYSHNANTISSVQTITSANITNVSSVTLSSDKHWLYVGGNNTVEAYYANTGSQYSWVKKVVGTGSFGQVVKTFGNGSKVIVAAPTADNVLANNGNVYIYSFGSNTFTLAQTLSSQTKHQSAGFGTSVAVDSTGTNVYIGIPGLLEPETGAGQVERYVLTAGHYAHNQTIKHPVQDIGQVHGIFGTSISVSGDGKVLAVGAQGASTDEHTEFDNHTTTIDYDTTNFVEQVLNTGATYIFEPLVDLTVTNDLGRYVYTQELETQILPGEQFGTSVDVSRSAIVVGAPNTDSSHGSTYVFANTTEATAWSLFRQWEPRVDLNSISRTFIYNSSNNNILAALDYIDPVKGKVLNSAARDIDYQLARDPALYNSGAGAVRKDLHWGPQQVGQIWWNLDTVRFIDYEQDSLNYRLNHWGDRFPGSSIDVYEWVESSVLPSEYKGSGTPLHADNSLYSTYGYVDSAGAVKVKYYFWVAGLDTVSAKTRKNNSVTSIASIIENPKAQGIPYVTVLRNDTVALHYVNHLLTGQNSIVHLGSQTEDPVLVHSEYALVQEGNPQSFIPASILTKFIDSLSGIDHLTNPVPDTTVPVSQQFGIGTRPRQSMIVNQPLALRNYLDLVNDYLLAYPVVERKVLTTLNTSEPIPSADAGEYSIAIQTSDELLYINPTTLTVGVSSVLVNTDVTQSGKWAIYTYTGTDVNNVPQYTLVRTQSYKTNLFWKYANWYDSTYDPTETPDITVATNLDLGKLTLQSNTHVKVLDAGQGKFAVYYIDSKLNKNLVGIENGTLQITGPFDGVNKLELRQILSAMQSEIFIDDLATEYNKIFFTMIKYILTEQKNLDWVFKTSFISATQKIRKLDKFASYVADNQDFYLDYINEVKPYRTVIREFVVDYIGKDSYNSDVTDFDLPSYWDANLQVYRSPSGEQPYDSTIRSTGVYSQWNNNYKYGVVDITVEDGGAGFLFPPQIIISGGGGSGATAHAGAIVDGKLTTIYIDNPGSGYTSQPTIVINPSDKGARAKAVLKNVYDSNNTGHNLVRSIKTNIKFDRITYSNPNVFVFWDNITTSNIGEVIPADTIIALNSSLYKLGTEYTINANVEFPVGQTTVISASTFNNANDRIVAFKGNIDFNLVDDGIDYPGVIVDGNTYTGSEYDSYISSRYPDALGVNLSDIDVDGGAYVDRYESHAPEELVPGRMYDSLNLTVFDRDHLAFRYFDTMNEEHNFYRIATDNTTTLSAELSLTDDTIYVADASLLPEPNPALAIPGTVFINGEKITYYTRDTENNTLGQIRRAVDGTSPQLVYAVETRVVDSSIQQIIPGADLTPVTLSGNVAYQAADIVTLGLVLTNKLTANVGDVITQVNQSTLEVTATLRVLENVVDAKVVAVLPVDGTVTGLPDTFDSLIGLDALADDQERQAGPYAPTRRQGDVLPTWQANTSYDLNTAIYHSGNVYIVRGNVNGATFDAISSHLEYSERLTTEYAFGTTVEDLTLQVGDQWWNTSSLALYVWNGSIWVLDENGDPGMGFDNTTGTIFVNDVPTAIYVDRVYKLGMVSNEGIVDVPPNTTVFKTQSWYNPGAGTATDGQGLINSTTDQAKFLKASRGYAP